MTTLICRKSSDPTLIKNEILKIEDRDQFNYQIACWALEFGWDEIRVYSNPTMPEKVNEFLKMPENTKRTMRKNAENYTQFWHDSQVYNYFESKKQIQDRNYMNLQWLIYLKKIFDQQKDSVRFEIVQTKIYDFMKAEVEFSEMKREPVKELDWEE